MQDYFSDYYLEIVKDGDSPKWPRPEEELSIQSQPLGGGYTQFWAYPKDSEGDHEALPHAEVIASQNPAHSAVVLIDQLPKKESDKQSSRPDGLKETVLELVLAKDGHAWGKTESSVANLEDNLSSLLTDAKDRFNLEVEHFMTTSRVSSEVEKKLDDLESAAGNEVETAVEPVGEQTAVPQEHTSRPPVINTPPTAPEPIFGNELRGSNKPSSNKLGFIIPLALILAIFGGVVVFRDKIMSQINSFQNPTPAVTPTPTVIPSPTPTPTPAIDRSQLKVRVLNGTTKTGAAGTLASKLKDLGWQILSTGNAANQATEKTTIKAKDASAAAVLSTDLADDYQATIGANLKASDKADLEVVIGKE